MKEGEKGFFLLQSLILLTSIIVYFAIIIIIAVARTPSFPAFTSKKSFNHCIVFAFGSLIKTWAQTAKKLQYSNSNKSFQQSKHGKFMCLRAISGYLCLLWMNDVVKICNGATNTQAKSIICSPEQLL